MTVKTFHRFLILEKINQLQVDQRLVEKQGQFYQYLLEFDQHLQHIGKTF